MQSSSPCVPGCEFRAQGSYMSVMRNLQLVTKTTFKTINSSDHNLIKNKLFHSKFSNRIPEVPFEIDDLVINNLNSFGFQQFLHGG